MSGRARRAGTAAVAAVAALALLAACARERRDVPGTAAVDTASVPPAAGDNPLTWPRVPGADVYRVEVYDAANQLVSAAITRDTFAASRELVPDTLRAGTWRVIAVAADGRETATSAPVGFHRRPAGGR